MQADAHRGVSTRLTAGRLEGISVPDLFWSLSTARATGVLHLTAGILAKRVYFASGQITFAASTDPNDRLGELLLRQGTIRLDHFERAVARLTDGRRLGTILVESGQLSPENLITAVRDQVRHIVWSLLSWEDGEYRFDEGPLPIDEIVTLDIDTASILLHGMRSMRAFQRIRRSVGPPNTRYQAVESWRDAVAGLDLTDGERQLLERLEGTGRTVESLCEEVFLSNFEIHQALWAFKVLGWARDCGRAILPQVESSASGGCLDNDGIGKLLVRLARAGETGVLQICRSAAERTFHLREGRLVFATSNNVDDGLVAYLLRRGMISLRDREETARRLLSNKRVGQILLEMNVIEEKELSALVREHQTEIILDTFRWDDGGWVWISGELPTIESIVLDRPVDDVVLAGIRRVAAWTRVREGCGGFSTRLELTANYLEVLDRMNISAEDWEMIANLRVPTTPLQVCRALDLGDFRVCQNLWALRLLGVIHEAPLEVALDQALGSIGVNAAANDVPSATTSVPDAPATPIAPTAIDAEAPFEVTTLQEMSPDAPADERAVPASTWTEPTEEAPGPWTWRSSDERPAPLEVSEVSERGELIKEAWRLAGDDMRTAEPQSAAESEAPASISKVEESAFALVPEGERRDRYDPDSLDPAADSAFEEPAAGSDESHEARANSLGLAAGTGYPEWADVESPAASPVESPAASPVESESHSTHQRAAESHDAEPCGMSPLHAESRDSEPLDSSPVGAEHCALDSRDERPQDAEHFAPGSLDAESRDDRLDAEPLDDARLAAEPRALEAWDERRLDANLEEASTSATDGNHSPAEHESIRSRQDDASWKVDTHSPAWSSDDEANERFRSDMANAMHEERGSDVPDLPARPWMVEEPEAAAAEVPEASASADVAKPEAATHNEPWEAPADLDSDLHRFVECHKVVFRVIRSEVGAGAINFVRSCRGGLTSDAGDILAAVEMNSDGGWDTGALGALIRERRLAAAPTMFRSVIEQEIAMLRPQIGERRTRSLLEQIEAIAGGAASAR